MPATGAHLDNREQVVRQYAARIVDAARQAPSPVSAEILTAHCRNRFSGIYDQLAATTNRPRYRPDAETCRWISMRVGLLLERDVALAETADALEILSSAAADVDHISSPAIAARTLESAINLAIDRIGRAHKALADADRAPLARSA